MTPYKKTIQLRPSFSHIDVIESKTKETRRLLQEGEEDPDRDRDDMDETGGAGGEEEKATAISVQFKRKESEQILAARLQSVNFLQKQIDEEPFTPLVLHGETSEMSQMQFERLSSGSGSSTSSKNNEIQSHGDYIAMISPSTYLVKGEQCASNLVQGFSADSLAGHGLADQVRMIFRHLKLVPIYRLKELLSRNPEGDSGGCGEGLLELVKENAVLVSSQFHWVAKSHLLYDRKRDERLIHARNLLLHLLHANVPVTRKAIVDDAKVPADKISEMLHPIAVLKRGVGWVLRPIPQNQYLSNQHLDAAQTLVQQQAMILQDFYREAMDYFARGGSELKGASSSKGGKQQQRRQSMAKVVVKAEAVKAEASPASVIIPNDPAADDKVSVLLLQLLRTHGICDLEYLLSSILSSATETKAASSSSASSSKPPPLSTTTHSTTPAIKTKDELKRVLQALPVTILPHECYAAHAIGDPAIDPHRQAILQEFQKKSSLKKSEIMAAVGTDLPPNIYQRLMKSIAVTKGSAWFLRPSPSPSPTP